ncbi:hypothetical protein [Pseudolabrys sp. FHR47]|uniref:hypothetical protein n=1 Tax=Pseudolabrys sp. FHR47 TaxID=2562284 RepID=UPI0010BEA2A7|nr:hypothetical protein [Pseudolabrys sp. FHR47]
MPLWASAQTGHQRIAEENTIRTAIRERHRGGVTVDVASDEAVQMVIDANLPAEEHAAFRPKGRRR